MDDKELLPVNPLQERVTDCVLTPRLIEILPLILRGMSHKEMSEILNLTEIGVRKRMEFLLARFKLKSRQDLFKKATSTGLHYKNVKGEHTSYFLKITLESSADFILKDNK